MKSKQTKPIGTSVFNVRGWILNVAVLATAASALAATHYVDVNSTNAMAPYANWATAATNIQDAVDAAAAGDEIVVTNGTYATGGRTIDGVTTNRVVVDKGLKLRSVNGARFTVIDGGGSVRCAYLTNGPSLSGFTLTNGAGGNGCGVSGGSPFFPAPYGGTLNNCTIINNRWANLGGGAICCTLNNCTLTGNSGNFGAGASHCTLNNCALTGNSADSGSGAGAYSCTLNNCTLAGNYMNNGSGGGAASCTLNNCTLTGNSVNTYDLRFDVTTGGGADNSTLNNCILMGNSANDLSGGGFTILGGGANHCTLNYCDLYENSPDAYNNTVNHPKNSNPLFVDTNGWANLRLQPNSPCINDGNNSYVTNATDLDGNPRISGGTVDIGAYEFQWPRLTLIPYGAYVLLTWPTNNAGYDYTGFTLQSSTNLLSPVVWSTNSPAPVVIGGQNVVINPRSGPQQFFRLKN